MLKRFIGGLLLALGLAVAGLPAAGISTALAQGTVPQQYMNAQTGTTYTFVARDCSKMVTFSSASAVAVTLPQAGTGGFLQGCFIDVKNLAAGVVTITPTTSKIDTAAALVVPQNASRHITTNGTDYFTQPGATALGIALTGSTVNMTLGTNSPSTQTSPYRWLPLILTDGTTTFFPVWK